MLQTLKLPYGKIILVERIEDGHFESPSGCYNTMPRFCRVVAEASMGEGSKVRIEVWMPEQWNGIFIGHGNGGIAGRVMHHNLEPYIKNGYAIAQSDLGSSDGMERGVHNPELWKDFGGRANIVMTEVGKAVVNEYYGRTPQYSYFIGASTGGQQSFSVAQRYPEAYDGIIAGVPANNRLFLHIYTLWNKFHMHTKDGQKLFTEEDIYHITELATAFFQGKGDGEPGDHFVTFPYYGRSTVEDFLVYLREQDTDFSEEQIDALRAVYNGPVNPVTKEQIYNGMPIGSEIYGGGMISAMGGDLNSNYPIRWAFGREYDARQFDYDKDLDALIQIIGKDLNANQCDLSAFLEHGGKLIAYAGVSDPCVPYPDAIKYYNRVCKRMGGYDKVKDFYRFFLFPGKAHGDDGRGANTMWNDAEGTNLVDALRSWREEGKAPEYLIAAHVEPKAALQVMCVGIDADREAAIPFTTFQRKIYPYQADWKEGENFPVCCADRYLGDKE